MAEKGKKVVLKIAKKLEMIFKIEKGVSRKQMCLDYGIGETTVRGVLKQKDKLLAFASVSESASRMEKQKIFFDLLGLEGNFDALSGWLHRFKKHHGIREIGLHGEMLRGDQQAAHDFEEFVLYEDLSYEQIYNADESGLFWKFLPLVL